MKGAPGYSSRPTKKPHASVGLDRGADYCALGGGELSTLRRFRVTSSGTPRQPSETTHTFVRIRRVPNGARAPAAYTPGSRTTAPAGRSTGHGEAAAHQDVANRWITSSEQTRFGRG
jgi:hypothetical protein